MSNEDVPVAEQVALDEVQVRAYLEAHPQFFENQADFLAGVQLNHSQRGSISLVDRQLEKLREQNMQLREEITELMGIAKHNETIYRNFCTLYLALLPCTSINEVQQKIQHTLTELLDLNAITMWPLSGQQDWVPRRKPVDHKALSELVRHRLGDEPFYFGRLSEQDRALVFDEENVQSAALMTLEDESILLAFGSQDSTHFNPNLDVLLLNQLRTLVSSVLRQIRERRHA
ncbi:DUF484 family protein [Echinimonas agarilytica]|uniref:DUF484 family protein n=1 Tax=Echinimonas agarilytica TaxID=1215918 RepID=A0AA41W3S3_9GAMM|nr:DUF484 family protein [Echinimonas agarilytica]MCM2678259.1 DUF484 family protein [Echinimonas agarilytica]